MAEFERPSPTESADVDEIVRWILTLQARFAREEDRPLGRGTHAKGICAHAVFEVLDLDRTVSDPELARRLARGPFARAGRYPAVVRFANAESRVQSDRASDVRALSFSVTFPPEEEGGPERRVDFSMNDAPTFPINDPHAFAVLLRVLAAKGLRARLGAFLRLNRAERRGLFRTARVGGHQKKRPKTGYQGLRYWSCVPFMHGPDEAIKYSAIPDPENPCGPLDGSDEELRNELMRHLVSDPRMSAFDFSIQLLDAKRMTHRGRFQDRSFWVENAGIEWNEDEAPFHRVARLTLVPASQLSDAECEAQYIDVTEHRMEENRPIGGINRARWASERGSRLRRLDPPAGMPRPAPGPAAGRRGEIPVLGGASRFFRRAGALPVGKVARAAFLGAGAFVLMVSALAFATMVYSQSGRAMLPPEPTNTVLFPEQGWEPGLEEADRQLYYYTSQGAGLRGVRYSWFVHLEVPWGRARLADPERMRRWGFLVDPATAGNPDRLPVGFTRHFDRAANDDMLSITCAACHTGELHVTRDGRARAVRIDGGQAMHAFTDASFGNFLPTMITSLLSTATNPIKFNRFARKVLGDGYPNGRRELHREMREVLGTFMAIGWNERKLYPTQEGYGRTDALARIANTVFGEELDHQNLAIGNAPVNYPPLWNIWKFDWVQYNGSVSQPMARNIGEAMGVGARYALVNPFGSPIPEEERFRSSAILENLNTIELALRRLSPPVWQEEAMGPIDRALAETGRGLFNQHCVGCHGPHVASDAVKTRNAPLKGPDDPEWIVTVLCVDDIGTDPNAAVNFAHAMVDISRTGITPMQLRAVAYRNLAPWRERQDALLADSIAAVQARLAGIPSNGNPSTSLPTRGELEATLAALERERSGLTAAVQQRLSDLDPERLPVGLALSYLGTMVRDRSYRDLGLDPSAAAEFDGFGILDLPQIVAGYKARPLAGIWATPPYLHNGSVPTVYDLLSPVADRPTSFSVGSREFDTVRLGLKEPSAGRWFTFDTSLPGNHHTGHEFNEGYVPWTPGSGSQGGLIGPLLTHDERMAIIEHLKVRDDDTEAREGGAHPTPACPVPAQADS
jgi:mono/diheme cytochrome c family protein